MYTLLLHSDGTMPLQFDNNIQAHFLLVIHLYIPESPKGKFEIVLSHLGNSRFFRWMEKFAYESYANFRHKLIHQQGAGRKTLWN